MPGKVLVQKVKYNEFDQKLSETNPKSSEVKNNLDPGQATMVVYPDTMYTHIGIPRGVQN